MAVAGVHVIHAARRLALTAFLLLVATVPRTAHADFDAGLAAHRAGDYARALAEFRAEAERGNTAAQFNVGFMLMRGQGAARDPAEAAGWYRRAADGGHQRAMVSLGDLLADGQGVPRDDAAALALYRRAAERGHTDGAFSLAWMLERGRGAAKDEAEAAAWYRKAAEAGHARAQRALGLLYETGRGVAKDEAEAVKWFRRSAASGLPEGQYALGFMLLNGRGTAKDTAAAIEQFRKAAEQDHVVAMQYLGDAYLEGDGVARDDAEAAKWYRRAAERGYSDAQYSLGWVMIRGRGTDKDPANAVEWLRRAAGKGHRSARYELALLYRGGNGVAKDSAEALKLLRPLAEDGHAAAQFVLGEMSADGEGMAADAEAAASWYKRAADQGHERARTALARLISGGSKASDPASLRRLLTRSAEAGDRQARLRLAAMLEAGVGGPVDRAAAKRHYTAAQSGKPPAEQDMFDGRAALGLVRLERGDDWERERRQWRLALEAGDQAAAPSAAAGRILLVDRPVRRSDFTNFPAEIQLRDGDGARVFAGQIEPGTSRPVPPRTDLMLFNNSNYRSDAGIGKVLDRLRVVVDGKDIVFDETTRAAAGIRLDPDMLLAGGNVAVDEAVLRRPVRADPRITVKAVTASRIDVYGPDRLIAFNDVNLKPGERFAPPAQAGMMLVAHSQSAVEIHVDGQAIFTLAPPPFREIELSMDASALAGARILTPEERRRGAARRDDPRPPPIEHVAASDGRIIGWTWLLHPARIATAGDGIANAVATSTLVIRGEIEPYYRNVLSRYQTALRHEGPNGLATIGAIDDIGYVHKRRGANALALDYLDLARTAGVRDAAVGRGESVSLLLAMAELYHDQQQPRLAERFVLRALALTEQNAKGARDVDLIGKAARAESRVRSYGDKPPTAEEADEEQAKAALSAMLSAYRLLAPVYADAGDAARAELYLARLSLVLELREPGSYVNVDTDPLLQLHAVMRAQGKPAAPSILRRAQLVARRNILGSPAKEQENPEPMRHPVDLSWTENVGGPSSYSRMNARGLLNMVEVYRRLGRWTEADPLLRRALDINRNIYGPDSAEAAFRQSELAEIEWRQGRLPRGLEQSRQALALLGRSPPVAVAPTVRHLELLADARAKRLEAGTRLVDEGFRSLQRARSSDTAGALASMAARFASGSDALSAAVRGQQDVFEQRRTKERELAAAIAEPVSARDLKQEAHMREEIAALDRRLAEIKTDLESRFPRYVELVDPKPLGVRDVRRHLWPNEAMIAYIVGAEQSYAFLIRRDRSRMVRLDIGAHSLDREVRRLRDTVDPMRLAEIEPRRLDPLDPLPFDLAASHALYGRILKPFEKDLSGITHLMIVADGALHQLPFGILVAQPPRRTGDAAEDYRAADWLFRRYAVTTLPTVSSLASLRVLAGKTRATDPLIGVGDPVLEGAPGRARGRQLALLRGGRVDLKELRQLEPLPDSADELRALADTLKADGSSILLAHQATEQGVRRRDLTRARVVAFATHGLVSGELGGLREPALVLTPPPADMGEDNDGLLTASEIARGITLDADMVILSACNTAAGDGSENAEGLSGLAKAFFYAGTRSLLVSHWSVASDAAVRLTTGTFRVMSEQPETGRSEALRRSMLALLHDPTDRLYAHPMIWAPFIIAGEGDRGGPPEDMALPEEEDDAQPPRAATPSYVAANTVNIRAEPSTAGRIVGKLAANVPVSVLETVSSQGRQWHRVAQDGRPLGFVLGELLKPRP